MRFCQWNHRCFNVIKTSSLIFLLCYMKNVSAPLLLIAYLGFILSVFIHTHHDLHINVCDKAVENLLIEGASETSENCCGYGLMSEKLKLNAQHPNAFYKLIIPGSYVLKSNLFKTTLLQKSRELYTPCSTPPLTDTALYLSNRVLLIWSCLF